MTTKRKPAPKERGPKDWFNRAYVYGERHVATVALVALGLGVVLTAIAAYSFFHEQAIERRVTKVESPCNIHPAGKACQGIKQRSDEKRSVASACVLAYKLDKDGQLLRLTKCPVEPGRQKRVEAAEKKSGSGPIAAAESAQGGDALQPSTATQQPGPTRGSAPGSGGESEAGRPPRRHEPKVPAEQGGGTEAMPPSAPTSPPAPSSSGTSSSSTTTERSTETTVVEPAPEPPRPSVLGEVTESVGNTVEGLGETVAGTVEGVESTTCQLAKLLCHE